MTTMMGLNLIPPQFKIYLYALAAILIFSSGCWVTHKIDEAGYQKAENDRIAKELKANELKAAGAVYIDDIRTIELREANEKIKGLRWCLVNGTCRLSIPAVCEKTSAGTCVDNAARRAYLNPATATGLVDITQRCDNITIRLSACQDIVENDRK